MAKDTQQATRPDSILAQIKMLEEADKSKVIKVRTRRGKVRSEYVGHTLGVFNGRGYTNIRVSDEMVGHEFGKFAPRVAPTAQTRYLSIPPRKMRQVAGLIKGQPVEKALNILNFTPKIAAYHMAKVLKAAVANKLSVEGTSHLDPEHLYVSTIAVDPAPSAKRIQYRSMGRIYRLKKRFCHLGIYLDVDQRKLAEAQAKLEAKAGGKKKTAAKKTVAKKTAAKTTAAQKTQAKKTATKKTAAKKTAAKKTVAKKTAANKDDKK